MANEIKNIPLDYVTKDYDGFFQMMKEAIPTLTPEWTDTSDTDPGIVNLQLLSYGLHILGYQQERATRENLLPLARTKEAILRLSGFLGYEPEKQKPATGTVTLTKFSHALNKRVVVPRGTEVGTNSEAGEPIKFETMKPLVIDSGESSGQVIIEHGVSENDEVLGNGNGKPNQQFFISYPDVIEKSLQVMTEENDIDFYWERVDNFVDSGSNDRHYTTEVDDQGRTKIIFGDGAVGVKPPDDSVVQASYRHGGGEIGNLDPNMIVEVFSSNLSDIESVTNTEATTGGSDFEDLEVTKTVAPISYRTGGKIVTPYDLEDEIITTYPSIFQAKVVEKHDLANNVDVHIAKNDYQPMTTTFQNDLIEDIEEKLTMNQTLNLIDATYSNYTLDVTVYIQDNFLQSSVKLEVENMLAEELEASNFSFGDEVFLSEIVHKLFFVKGVRNAVINSPASDVITGEFEIPKLDSVNVTIQGGVASE